MIGVARVRGSTTVTARFRERSTIITFASAATISTITRVQNARTFFVLTQSVSMRRRASRKYSRGVSARSGGQDRSLNEIVRRSYPLQESVSRISTRHLDGNYGCIRLRQINAAAMH